MKQASMANEAGFIAQRSKLHLPSKLYSFLLLNRACRDVYKIVYDGIDGKTGKRVDL